MFVSRCAGVLRAPEPSERYNAPILLFLLRTGSWWPITPPSALDRRKSSDSRWFGVRWRSCETVQKPAIISTCRKPNTIKLQVDQPCIRESVCRLLGPISTFWLVSRHLQKRDFTKWIPLAWAVRVVNVTIRAQSITIRDSAKYSVSWVCAILRYWAQTKTAPGVKNDPLWPT